MVRLAGGIEQRGPDVLGLKKWVVAEDFLVGRAGGEKLEQIHDPEPGATDARSPATLAGFDGDSMGYFHGRRIIR